MQLVKACCRSVLFHSLSRRGRTVIFSIHQPRYAIYKLFDRLTLLAAGHTVFHGPAKEALDYFSAIGKWASYTLLVILIETLVVSLCIRALHCQLDLSFLLRTSRALFIGLEMNADRSDFRSRRHHSYSSNIIGIGP